MGEDTPECVTTPVLFGNRISGRVCRGLFAYRPPVSHGRLAAFEVRQAEYVDTTKSHWF